MLNEKYGREANRRSPQLDALRYSKRDLLRQMQNKHNESGQPSRKGPPSLAASDKLDRRSELIWEDR